MLQSANVIDGQRRPLFAFAVLATILFWLAGAGAAHATAKEIDWKDLVPDLPPLADPLDALEFEQRFELESILWVRQLSEVERRERADIVEEAKAYEREFEKRGMPVDKLIADYADWTKKIEKRQRMMNESLNGQTVTLRGYLLPIEFSEEGVTDFLIVPYVGACIHVPAPPANQIVFAELPKKMKVQDLFTAAKITGKLTTKLNEKQLNLSDGSAPVPVGYQLAVDLVEIVKE
jgi:hypothetical protein